MSTPPSVIEISMSSVIQNFHLSEHPLVPMCSDKWLPTVLIFLWLLQTCCQGDEDPYQHCSGKWSSHPPRTLWLHKDWTQRWTPSPNYLWSLLHQRAAPPDNTNVPPGDVEMPLLLPSVLPSLKLVWKRYINHRWSDIDITLMARG